MKKGFTLIELLVYMIIMGFIIVVAGRVFSDSTRMRVRSQNMVKSMEEAGQVALFIKEDVSKMGTKTYGKEEAEEGSTHAFYVPKEIYMDETGNCAAANRDVSSYDLNPGGEIDELTFRKVEYDEDGDMRSVREITWSVGSDGRLMRNCEIVIGEDDSECASENVEMARDVAKFKFFPSKPALGSESSGASDTLMFPETESSPFQLISRDDSEYKKLNAGSGSSITVEGFKRNNLEEGEHVASQLYLAKPGAGDNWLECEPFKFEGGVIYAMEFGVDGFSDKNPMNRFQPGKDHLSAGIRELNSGNSKAVEGVPDFMFYPKQNKGDNRIRYFEFSVPRDIEKACVAITAAFYSDIEDGSKIVFKNFRLYRKHDKAYSFPDDGEQDLEGEEKAFVKAFRLELSINKGGEINETKIVIPVPNNGVCIEPGGGAT